MPTTIKQLASNSSDNTNKLTNNIVINVPAPHKRRKPKPKPKPAPETNVEDERLLRAVEEEVMNKSRQTPDAVMRAYTRPIVHNRPYVMPIEIGTQVGNPAFSPPYFLVPQLQRRQLETELERQVALESAVAEHTAQSLRTVQETNAAHTVSTPYGMMEETVHNGAANVAPTGDNVQQVASEIVAAATGDAYQAQNATLANRSISDFTELSSPSPYMGRRLSRRETMYDQAGGPLIFPTPPSNAFESLTGMWEHIYPGITPAEIRELRAHAVGTGLDEREYLQAMIDRMPSTQRAQRLPENYWTTTMDNPVFNTPSESRRSSRRR